MPRKPRITEPGFYHVISRGVERRNVFLDTLLEKIYMGPKYIKKDGAMKILYKRLETFFEKDKDINRNINIKKAYNYGYTKSEIAKYLELSHTSISKVIKSCN